MTNVDQEIEAIKAVLGALEPLPAEVRSSVLEYVTRRLAIHLSIAKAPSTIAATSSNSSATPPSSEFVHIKSLKESKNPRSANEMAALVAYWLAEVAPDAERKQAINSQDVRRYFKIAGFPLPRQPVYTLPNAKSAGYFDQAGPGEFRLNPVGYNLVVHAMPRGAGVAKKK